eukprot:Sdes_comp13678_c0_seq1m3268
MMSHKQKFESIVSNHEHELDNFWLRKTKKPVLSVLLVHKSQNSAPFFIRGMNVEVSMPTGTLCAERNAIGNALANDPSLSRRDFKMMAVLSLPFGVKKTPKQTTPIPS